MKPSPSFLVTVVCPFVFTFVFTSVLIFGGASVSLASAGAGALNRKAALQQLVAASPRWKQIGALREDAIGKRRQARSAVLPHVGFYTREFAGRINPIQYGLAEPTTLSWFAAGTVGVNFAYPVLDFASFSRSDAALENEKAVDQTIEDKKNDLLSLLGLQLLTVQKYQRNLEMSEAGLKRDYQIIDLAQRRVKFGSGIQLDLNRARSLLERDQAKRLETQANLLKACSDLGVTLNLPDFDCKVAPLPIAASTASPVASDRGSNLELKNYAPAPNVKAAQLLSGAAHKMHEFSERGWWPKMLIFGETGFFGSQPLGIGGQFSGILGIQVTFPIYDAGLESGKSQEEGARAQQAELQAEYLERESRAQLETSKSQLKLAKEALEITHRQIELAKAELKLLEEKFRLGSASSLELSSAVVNLATITDFNVQAVYSYQLARLAVYRVLGQAELFFQEE